jgi:5-formyltetrahydrofolate cyclo-ligase
MFLDQRMQLSPSICKNAADQAYEIFFKNVPLKDGAIVAGYWPIRGELDDLPILKELLRRHHLCALPHVADGSQPLTFRAWSETTPMTPGKYSIMEPAGDRTLVPDIILVPMAAFDKTGHRLGYGAGFYDLTIARLKASKPVLVVGLAYEAQACAGLPAEDRDVRMDMIVTDKNFYTFGGAGR